MNATASPPKRNSGTLMVSALILALFPMAIWYLNQQQPATNNANNSGSSTIWSPSYMREVLASQRNANNTQDSQTPRFTFYDILPKLSVDTERYQPPAPTPRSAQPAQPVARIAPAVAKPTVTAAAQPVRQATPSVRRASLQVGAFSQASQANRQRAKLALLGLRARVASSGNIHRLVIGPVQGDALNKTKQRLANAGIAYSVY